MKRLSIILLTFNSFLFFSCQKDEDLPLSSFNVIVSHVTSNNALIEWEAPKNSNNDHIYFSVFLNDSLIADSLSNIYKQLLTNLQPETLYTGYIMAYKSANNATRVEYKFNTFKNNPPDSVKISFLEIKYNYAIIEWEPVSDTDGDSVYYSITINGIEVASELTNQFSYSFIDLIPETYYSGFIKVTDEFNSSTITTFSFTTPKYYLTYSKLIQFNGVTPTEYSIDKTSDGGYIIGADIYLVGSGGYFMAIKIDSEANIQWYSLVEINNASMKQVKQISDGGYILLTCNNIYKLNEIGQIVWSHTSENEKVGYNSFIQTNDNCIIVTGAFLFQNDGILTQVLYSKFDIAGNLLWEKYHGSSRRSEGSFIYFSEDKPIILGSTGGDNYANLFVLQIDLEGNVIWENTYTGLRYDFARQIKKTKDGGFIICGYSWDYQNVSNARVLKINYQGLVEWDNFFRWDSFNTTAFAVDQSIDGSYVFTGSNGYRPQDCILVKLDSSGNLIWKKSYKPNYMDYYWHGKDLKATKDGGFIILGRKSWVWSGDGKEDGLWILKTDPNGE